MQSHWNTFTKIESSCAGMEAHDPSKRNISVGVGFLHNNPIFIEMGLWSRNEMRDEHFKVLCFSKPLKFIAFHCSMFSSFAARQTLAICSSLNAASVVNRYKTRITHTNTLSSISHFDRSHDNKIQNKRRWTQDTTGTRKPKKRQSCSGE